ncbi:MAG TPA: hypothetical protein VF898_12940 [Chloroflexota bacterium]
MSEEYTERSTERGATSRDQIDSADRLTGGYGGEPEEELEAEATSGTSAPRDLGSSSDDSGLTAGGTDTSVDPQVDDAP